MIYHIIKNCGKSAAFIGTSIVLLDGEQLPFNMTTPDPIFLQSILFKIAQKNIEYLIMEVSAHAIFYQKILGLKSKIAVFTNFSQDHLDFFKTMENYKNVKLSFFNSNYCESAVINIDDEISNELIQKLDIPYATFGIKNPSDVFAIKLKMNIQKSEFVINMFDYVEKVALNIPALYNIYNALCACCVCTRLNFDKKSIINAINSFSGFAGRFEVIKYKTKSFVIDYAHTPKGMENLLQTVKQLTKKDIICVFGCPGNRDETKRSIMGEIAGRMSKNVIITSDNPKYENPIKILNQIETGLKKRKANYTIIEDREKALKQAFELCSVKDIVVILGKGAENFQDINGVMQNYNDRVCLTSFFEEK